MTDTMRAALARLRRPIPRPRRYAALAAAGAPDMETRLAADVVPLADYQAARDPFTLLAGLKLTHTSTPSGFARFLEARYGTEQMDDSKIRPGNEAP